MCVWQHPRWKYCWRLHHKRTINLAQAHNDGNHPNQYQSVGFKLDNIGICCGDNEPWKHHALMVKPRLYANGSWVLLEMLVLVASLLEQCRGWERFSNNKFPKLLIRLRFRVHNLVQIFSKQQMPTNLFNRHQTLLWSKPMEPTEDPLFEVEYSWSMSLQPSWQSIWYKWTGNHHSCHLVEILVM